MVQQYSSRSDQRGRQQFNHAGGVRGGRQGMLLFLFLYRHAGCYIVQANKRLEVFMLKLRRRYVSAISFERRAVSCARTEHMHVYNLQLQIRNIYDSNGVLGT